MSVSSHSSVTSEYFQKIEIDTGHEVYAVAFTADSKHLVIGINEGVGVWRVQDSERVAEMPVKDGCLCVAVSRNGKWIAGGSSSGEISVWDATAYERVLSENLNSGISKNAIDFSPDSSQLIVAASDGMAATFDIAETRVVQTFHYAATGVIAVKYSPRDDRVATASLDSVQIWDGKDGHLLVGVEILTNPLSGLVWLDDHLFIVANDGEIKRIDASTGSTVSQWSVPHTNYTPCFTLPQSGEYLAYSAGNVIKFWSTSTHSSRHLITCHNDICSTSVSPDDQLLASGMEKGRVVVTRLSFVREPEICIDGAVLDLWRCNQLENAEALLTTEIRTTHRATHDILSARAFVKARLRDWHGAVADAEESVKVRPSVMGYVAKCVALVGRGERDEGLRVCDIAFQDLHADYVAFVLLIKAIVLFMAGEHNNAISRMDDLIGTVFFNSTLYVIQAYMYHILGGLQMERKDYKLAIQSFEHARVGLGNRTVDRPVSLISLIFGWKSDEFAITTQQCFCEALFIAGRTKEAHEFVLLLDNQEVYMTELARTWVSEFAQQCLRVLENADKASRDTDQGQTAHVLRPTPLAREWARSRLMFGSWKDALVAAVRLTFSRLVVYQVVCEHLEMTNQLVDAVSCFHRMRNELAQEAEQASWALDFQSRCRNKLEILADTAMNGGHYDRSISWCTLVLSLSSPVYQRDLLAKWGKAYSEKGKCEDVVGNTNEASRVDTSSSSSYERKSVALYGGVVDAFEAMLLRMSRSSDPEICERSGYYVRPEQIREAIRTTIEDAIRDFPSVLIDLTSGHLCNKSEQTSAFESTPAFMELMSTMTTHVDHARIWEEVGEFYRYATFSHKREENEPTFTDIQKTVVYDLPELPSYEKLKAFCKIVREAGFSWAWSDTCCVEADPTLIELASADLFKWYEGSAMTIVFLRGVHQFAQRGALARSTWNTQVRTLVEYHASKVVQFYTEDWTPYLDLRIHNHKESPEIISEMEEATGISASALTALRPGYDNVHEKLRLFSTREHEKDYDVPYASPMLGIFTVRLSYPQIANFEQAFAELLTLLLERSEDTSVLAWTGRSGKFNSCLPANITVYNEFPTSHIPPPLSDAEMAAMTARLRSLDLTLVTRLDDQLRELSFAYGTDRCLRIPCIRFSVIHTSSSRDGQDFVFHARTSSLGVVKIRSREDLSRESLYFIHPWIDYIRDMHSADVTDVRRTTRVVNTSDYNAPVPSSQTTRASWFTSCLGQLFRRPPTLAPTLAPTPSDTDSVRSRISPEDKETFALQCLARLSQPFGAFLLKRSGTTYKRVATENLITAQVTEITSETLKKLIRDAMVVDVF